jgi:hypothetical protein
MYFDNQIVGEVIKYFYNIINNNEYIEFDRKCNCIYVKYFCDDSFNEGYIFCITKDNKTRIDIQKFKSKCLNCEYDKDKEKYMMTDQCNKLCDRKDENVYLTINEFTENDYKELSKLYAMYFYNDYKILKDLQDINKSFEKDKL